MRRKKSRLVSFTLAAVLVISSVNVGTVSAAEADTGMVETQAEVATDEDSTEAVSEAEAETDIQKEEADSEAVSTQQDTSEAVTEEVTETTTEGDVETPAEVDTEEEDIVSVEETIEKTTATASEGTLVYNLIADKTLFDIVLSAYNEGAATQKDKTNFTYGDLSAYEGAFDFSSAANAASVKSIEGLGCAQKVQSIDMSGFTGVTTIPAEEFSGCAFETINLPSSITTIGTQAFFECKNLTTITLPDTLQSLGQQAFASCTSLQSVHSTKAANTLPSGLTVIKEQVFLDDVSLEEIAIPSFANGRIMQDEPSLFAGCKKLAKVTIGESITTIPASAFSRAGTDTTDGLEVIFEADSQLDKILGSAFSGSKLADTVDFTNCDKLTSIESSAFEGAEGLTTVILPNKTTGTLKFGDNVFAKTKLTTIYEAGGSSSEGVVLPDYVNGIGQGCFYSNDAMTRISLSPALTAIPDYTFDGCTALAEVEQRQSGSSCEVKEIGDCAFRSTAITNTDFLMNMNKLETIGYQRMDLVTDYGIETVGKTETQKSEAEKVKSLPVGGVATSQLPITIYDTHQKKKSNTEYYGSEVFTNCSQLTSVKIPASVKNIGGRAFYFVNYKGASDALRSNITSVTWASDTAGQTRNIYAEAFQGNANLETVVLPDNTNAKESMNIGAYAFHGCAAITKLGVAGETDNVLPASVASIADGAFFRCQSLPNITIQSMRSGACPELGIKVFEQCSSLAKATVPEKITEIPRHFFYNAPINEFNVGNNQKIGITKIGDLAFMGNAFTTLDLTKYTELIEIGGGAFANVDTLIESGETKTTAIGASHAPCLTTVILPNTMKQNLFINSCFVYGQLYFTTMKTASHAVNGEVYIPDYVYENNQQAMFGGTGLTKVVWQADTTGKNVWESIPVYQYTHCINIVDAKDVLPTGTYVTDIGQGAFYDSYIQSADLSAYKNLKELGSGTISGSAWGVSGKVGVFMQCPDLTSVKLPQTNTGVSLVVKDKTFFKSESLTQVDLGSTTEIAQEAFSGCTSLGSIVFPDTLTKLGQKAFNQCTSLETVDFGKLKEIGNYGFSECISLNLTNSGLPDTLETIGTYAFWKDTNLGKVAFGPALKKIDSYAFQKSGVTEADFTKAASLETINSYAFSETAIKSFKLSGTKVVKIPSFTLYGCASLTSASFGDEVLYIDQNALAGCLNLSRFEFASTTTVNNKVFYNYYTNPTTQNKDYTANGGTITIVVNTPDKTTIPIGRTITLPYYVNPKGTSGFDYVLVGDQNSEEEVKTHLKVSAKLLDGYYWKKQTNLADEQATYKIVDEEYYEALDATKTWKRTDITSSTVEVDVIDIAGVTATTEPINLSVTCSLTFECAPNNGTAVSVTASKFSAKYNIEVKEVPFCADLYTDNKRTQSVPYGQTEKIQATTSKKYMQYYFDINNAEEIDCTPDTYDVVVETDNPDVLYPSGTASGTKAASYETTRGTNTSKQPITPNTGSQMFYLVEAGVGTAHIKVYPKGHPEYARTYTYVVNADIQRITLKIPNDYTNGADVGVSFSVFDSYENCLKQTAKAEDMSKYLVYSNRKITYTSSDPEYVAVDDRGNVKILKADKSRKTVTITATAPTSNANSTVKATVSVRVNAQTGQTSGGTSGAVTEDPSKPVQNNSEVVDPGSGATYVVTKASEKDLQGEVKFSKTTDTANVVIPDTLTINGVQYKVTTIAANAFKGNTKIKTIKLGKYIKQIESNAFSNCKNLTKVTISDSVTKIGKKAFYNCKKLTTVSLSGKSKLTEIGDSAFYNCSKLKKITIPAKVKKIGAKAFYNCKSLKTITIKSTVLKKVGSKAFKNIHKKATIKVPKKKYTAYKKLLKGKGQKSTVKIKK